MGNYLVMGRMGGWGMGGRCMSGRRDEWGDGQTDVWAEGGSRWMDRSMNGEMSGRVSYGWTDGQGDGRGGSKRG